jgi:hypothetical protein
MCLPSLSSAIVTAEDVTDILLLARRDQNTDALTQLLEAGKKFIGSLAFIQSVKDKDCICELIARFHDQISEL